MLVMVAQGRQCDFRIAGLAVAQDDQPCHRDPLGQHIIAQNKGGKRKQPRVQRGEEDFAGGGHLSNLSLNVRGMA